MLTHPEQIKELAAALVAAAAEIGNPKKTAENPHYKSKYADLAEIVNVSRAVLARHGLVIAQAPGLDGDRVIVETILLHTSGEWLRCSSAAPLSKQDAQGVGSAVTYLRRYALAAMLGLAQEDDDGNAASKQEPSSTAARERLALAVEALDGVVLGAKDETARKRAITLIEAEKLDVARAAKAAAYLENLTKEVQGERSQHGGAAGTRGAGPGDADDGGREAGGEAEPGHERGQG